MNQDAFLKLVRRLLQCPAVAFQEGMVANEVRRICREHGLTVRSDPYGNLRVRTGRPRRGRELVLAAHMDHPGFELIPPKARDGWRARFLGGVPDVYFRTGIPLRLYPGGLKAALGPRLGREKLFALRGEVECAHAMKPTLAVWDVPDCAISGDMIRGRACDDLIGVAVILSVLIELRRRRSTAAVSGLISRAEEVGFQGALAAASSGSIPRKALVISLETSKVMAPVAMGQGVILRVGDRQSIFDSTATRFLAEVAAELKKRQPHFAVQRALMQGGSCEGTAFQDFGYQTAALCVPLGNYHNCGPGRGIRAEFVSSKDALCMQALLVEAARRLKDYDLLTRRLSVRLQGLLKAGKRRLTRQGLD